MRRVTLGYHVREGKTSVIAVDICDGTVLEPSGDLQVVGAGVVIEGDGAGPSLAVPSVTVSVGQAMVTGAGVASPSTVVLDFVSGVHRMNSRVAVPGHVDGFLPGYVGYEIYAPGGEPEQTALALRRECEKLRAAGVPVRRFVSATPASPQLLQACADVLGDKVAVATSDRPTLLGAAIYACLAAGSTITGYAADSLAVRAMVPEPVTVYRPDIDRRREYNKLFNV